jgi:hypothetical protein
MSLWTRSRQIFRFGPCLFTLTLSCVACRTEPTTEERALVTEVAQLSARPAAAVAPTPLAPLRSECADVERQARELGADLPRQLDADTRATRVSARGCDLTLEYELVTVSARDVPEKNMSALRRRVKGQLCSDPGVLGVMRRGGRVTNVYYDRGREPIDLFTVAADDCGI